MEHIFISIFLFGFLYSYVIYPIVIFLFCLLKRKQAANEQLSNSPLVSIIVAVHNEKDIIESKIKNLISLKAKNPDIEIIVSSDFSSDKTDDICKKYADENVIKYLRSPTREGKESAQRNALFLAVGEIIIFSDAATFIDRASFLNVLKYFSRPEVGAVSSQDVLINQHGHKDSENLYIKYEMFIRKMESRLAGTIGMSGSFFAARKELCFPWNEHTCSDFNIAINAARAGLLSVSANNVFGYYPNLIDINDEADRRTRTILRGMVGLYSNKDILNLLKYPMFAFQMLSHKLMRWLSPWFFLVLMIILSVFWKSNSIYAFIFCAQLALLFTYGLSIFFPTLGSNKMLKIPVFFVASNIAILKAGLKFLCGEKMKTWEPSRRHIGFSSHQKKPSNQS